MDKRMVAKTMSEVMAMKYCEKELHRASDILWHLYQEHGQLLQEIVGTDPTPLMRMNNEMGVIRMAVENKRNVHQDYLGEGVAAP